MGVPLSEGAHPRVVDLAATSSAAVPPGAVLVIPLGATEQHGPHLPLGTDTLIATAVAARLVEHLGPDRAVLAPAVPYGASGEHEAFAGTLSVGSAALEAVVVELVRSALPPAGGRFQGVVLVNGHGGNAAAVHDAVARLTREGRAVLAWAPRAPGGDAHAGRTETSLVLALAPGLVAPPPWPAGDTRSLAELLPALRAGGVGAVAANGVLGDPAGASAEQGRALLDALAADLVTAVTARWPAP